MNKRAGRRRGKRCDDDTQRDHRAFDLIMEELISVLDKLSLNRKGTS